MKPHLQRIKSQPSVDFDNKLSVHHETSGREVLQHRDNFREVAPEWFAGLGPQIDRVPALERKTAKSIPFRLILPKPLIRKLIHRTRLHRRGV